MYVLNISVDELNADLHFEDKEQGMIEFKECVSEIMNNPRFNGDSIIMRINNDYAIIMVQSETSTYKIELLYKEE